MDRSNGRETGYTVRPPRDDDAPGVPRVRALPLGELIHGFSPHQPVDYLYMDVEGAHEGLLKGGAGAAWATRVRAIKVAGHGDTDYNEDDCARDLERLGFRTRVIRFDPIGWTVGIR